DERGPGAGAAGGEREEEGRQGEVGLAGDARGAVGGRRVAGSQGAGVAARALDPDRRGAQGGGGGHPGRGAGRGDRGAGRGGVGGGGGGGAGEEGDGRGGGAGGSGVKLAETDRAGRIQPERRQQRRDATMFEAVISQVKTGRVDRQLFGTREEAEKYLAATEERLVNPPKRWNKRAQEGQGRRAEAEGGHPP